jgi:hypothetical protein
MCKAPKPPKPKEPKKPEFLRNRYLDEFVGQAQVVQSLRTGRSNLRIPLGSPAGIGGRQPGNSLVSAPPTTGAPQPAGPTPGPGIAPRRRSGDAVPRHLR